jgi:20S proteasome alpha/beta subunit
VTLIIGLICKDAILLGSDSQTTCGGTKRTDAEKIFSVTFGKNRALVACAGNSGNSARAVEIMRSLGKDQDITDYRLPAEVARTAVMQVKQELRQQYCDCTVEALQDFIWKDELQSELMIAYYFDKKPYIFKIDLAVARSDKEHSWYSASGTGAVLGSYLFCENTTEGMLCDLASIIMNHTVSTVCKHDAFCSPPTRMGIIIPDIIEMCKLRGTLPEKVHPTAIGTGLVIITKGKNDADMVEKIEIITRSEKMGRNKKFQKLLNKRSKVAAEDLKSLPNNTPSSKAIKRFGKIFSDIALFETFNSK